MRFLPVRRKNRGTQPGMSSKGMKNKEEMAEKQWYFPRNNPTEEVRRCLRGMVTEIAVRILWENYSYSFGGEIYLQSEGGPIGQRPTMAASRLVVNEFMDM